MPARIYKPSRPATQSGNAGTDQWVLEFVSEARREVDPLMGWTSNTDTQAQVRLRFPTKEAALEYARDHRIDAVVQEPHKRKPNIRPGGYAENFSPSRRQTWTH